MAYDGRDGINGKFYVGQFDKLAAIVRQRRVWKLSAQQRAKLAAATAPFARFWRKF